MSESKRIIVALDCSTLTQAYYLLDQLDPKLCRIKIGKEMFTLFGSEIIKTIISRNFEVFLDLKFHDIPTTVANACKAAADLGVWMLNVHALGGLSMLTAAANALNTYGTDKPILTAVTVLTSHSHKDLLEIGISLSPEDLAIKLAKLAYQAGLDGVVCSTQEVSVIKSGTSANFLAVTPGIRLLAENMSADDQKRIATPEEAIYAGSDYLVIGRPITQSKDPLCQLQQITIQINNALVDNN